ncbi:MAG: tetratricopeptide repeat protein [Rivularia sp. T60_A2020_040]|nr:tetratricopeptide repeat protein [Rivularia sp. T60_A2020_040]
MMNWITLLKTQQADFIERLKCGCLLHCDKIGQHSELTIISDEKLIQLRSFCWEMADKYKNFYSSPIRDVFINNLKGKLGEEVVKIYFGDLITEVDYEKRLGGDGKVDFTLTSDSSIGIQVKARYGDIDTVKWWVSKEEVEKNAVLICVLIQEEVNEAQSKYNLVLAGFLPTDMIDVNYQKVSFGIDSLLYAGGLHSYLSSLMISYSEDTIQENKIPESEANNKTSSNQQTEEYIRNQTSNQVIDYFIFANQLLKNGNYYDAFVNYSKVLQLNPNLSEPLLYRSYILNQTENIQEAYNDLSQAILINPIDSQLYFDRGDFLYRIGNLKAAIKDYNQGIKINPYEDYALFLRGKIFTELGEYKAAIEDYTKSIIINSKSTAAYFNRGFILYYHIGNTQKAIEDFSKAIRINQKYCDAFYWRGRAFYTEKLRKEAIADFTQVIKLNSNFSPVYFRRGITFAEIGEFQKAIKDYDLAIKINPYFAEAYESRGYVYDELGYTPLAIQDLKKAAYLYNKQGNEKGYKRVIDFLYINNLKWEHLEE